MKIGNSVGLGVYISVGAKVVRGDHSRIDSDMDSKSRSGNSEVFG